MRKRWKGGEGYYLLSSVITRCTLPSPVVTHCHPLPLVDTCYYPLSPAVTCRQPLSSVVRQVTRRRWHVLRVVLGASCFPGFLPPLLGGVDGTSCVLSWRLPAFRASCLPCLAELKTPNRHGCGMRGLQLGSRFLGSLPPVDLRGAFPHRCWDRTDGHTYKHDFLL